MKATALAILAPLHITLGLALLLAGVLALTARKSRVTRHRWVGELYFWLLSATLPAGMVDGLLRHPGTYTLFQVMTPPTFALGLLAYVMAKARPAGWLRWHIAGMGGSFIGVITAGSFQVFPRLLPASILLTMAYWAVPSAIGSVLIARTIVRWLPATHPQRS